MSGSGGTGEKRRGKNTLIPFMWKNTSTVLFSHDLQIIKKYSCNKNKSHLREETWEASGVSMGGSLSVSHRSMDVMLSDSSDA